MKTNGRKLQVVPREEKDCILSIDDAFTVIEHLVDDIDIDVDDRQLMEFSCLVGDDAHYVSILEAEGCIFVIVDDRFILGDKDGGVATYRPMHEEVFQKKVKRALGL